MQPVTSYSSEINGHPVSFEVHTTSVMTEKKHVDKHSHKHKHKTHSYQPALQKVVVRCVLSNAQAPFQGAALSITSEKHVKHFYQGVPVHNAILTKLIEAKQIKPE